MWAFSTIPTLFWSSLVATSDFLKVSYSGVALFTLFESSIMIPTSWGERTGPPGQRYVLPGYG